MQTWRHSPDEYLYGTSHQRWKIRRHWAVGLCLDRPHLCFSRPPRVRGCYNVCYQNTYRDFMGENKLYTRSRKRKREGKVRESRMLDHHLSTMNRRNKAVFRSDTTSDLLMGWAAKTGGIQSPFMFVFVFFGLVVSEYLKAKCLTELPDHGKIPRQLTSACFPTVQHWY